MTERKNIMKDENKHNDIFTMQNDIDYSSAREKVNYEICDTVGNIYKELLENGYTLQSISDEFLKSDFCKRQFDTNYSTFQLDDDTSIYYFLKECGKNLIKKAEKSYASDIAYWIGFMYRYIYIHTDISSSKICDIVPFDDMLKYIERTMYPFEEYSEDEVFEIIDKDKNFNQYK